ncbi:MAG TPA: hypothetical protein VFR46_07510, partial [Actinomycetes bacterium]|nr:hypothetical protein [Actinomycetes bacterium]
AAHECHAPFLSHAVIRRHRAPPNAPPAFAMLVHQGRYAFSTTSITLNDRVYAIIQGWAEPVG